MARDVTVTHHPRTGGPTVFSRRIGWSTVSPQTLWEARLFRGSFGERVITEGAAIGVMALLLHHLEGGQITSVLQIGLSADYLIQIDGRPYVTEVSGVRIDANGQETNSRRSKKRTQLFRGHREGYVSVTAFSHGENGGVATYFEFAEKSH